MGYRRLGPGTALMRRAVGLVFLVAMGCSRQEALEPDPGVSPFYPGPAAGAKAPAGRGASADRAASVAPKLDQPLRPQDVERQLRIALRAAERGDSAGAIALLDRILALEPVNREALYGRATVAMDQAKRSGSPEERDAALEKAGTMVRALHRAYEKPNQREVDLYSKVLYEQIRSSTAQGLLDRAVGVLKEAHNAGFDAFDRIDRDPELAKLRSFSGYLALVQSIDAASLAKARERVKDQLDRPLGFTLDFKLKDLEDRPLSLDQFKGKVVLVDIWGTWCGPCREAIPGLVQLYFKNRRRGFEVIGLDYEQNAPDPETARQQVKRFVQESRIPYRIAMGDDALLQTVKVQGFPTTILIDRSGKPRLLVTGGGAQTLDALNAATIVLLAEPATPAAGTGKTDKPDAPKPR
jgi:thiol-disulfide isomerase/thioredoxin